MNISENIIYKIVYLPENLQVEVLDFVESLFKKHHISVSETAENDKEYHHLLSLLLHQRSETAKQNPDNVLSSEENRKLLLEKFKWKNEQV